MVMKVALYITRSLIDGASLEPFNAKQESLLKNNREATPRHKWTRMSELAEC